MRLLTSKWLPSVGWILLAGFSVGAALIGDIYQGAVTIVGHSVLSIRVWQALYLVGVFGHVVLLLSFRARPVSAKSIIIPAIAMRMVLLLCVPNSDCNRYAWEGRIQNLGFSPYLVGPKDPDLEPFRDEIWNGINKKKFTTIYPPLSELEFRLLSWLHYSKKTPQVAHALLDVAVLLVLAGLLRRLRRPGWYVAIYALSPLTLSSFAHAGHNDTLMILPLLGFVAAAGAGRWRLAGAALGLAILAKTTPAILLALLVRKSRAGLAIALIIVAAGYLLYSEAGWKLFETLRTFPEDGPFNSLFDALRLFLNRRFDWRIRSSERMIIAMSIMGIAAAYRVWRPRDILTDARWLMALAVLLLPIIHFWYLAWPLALIALAPRGYVAWIVLAATNVFYWQSEWAGQVGLPWRLESWAVCATWIPFFLAWCAETIWVRRKSRGGSAAGK